MLHVPPMRGPASLWHLLADKLVLKAVHAAMTLMQAGAFVVAVLQAVTLISRKWVLPHSKLSSRDTSVANLAVWWISTI